MKYLVFATEALAVTRNEAEASARGCDSNTTQWWGRVCDPTSSQVALEIPESDQAGLSTSEHSSLVDYAALDASGWFPVPHS